MTVLQTEIPAPPPLPDPAPPVRGAGSVARPDPRSCSAARSDPDARRALLIVAAIARGEIELQIPRKRSGESYFPSFLEPRRRCEEAVVAVVMEAYVNGVSTRKVDRLVEQMGIHAMTKDRVSALCRSLDDQVQASRQRPLEGAHPYLWLDAKVVKVRDRGHVYLKALVIAYSVHETGRREVIGLDIGEIETESYWVANPAPAMNETPAPRAFRANTLFCRYFAKVGSGFRWRADGQPLLCDRVVGVAPVSDALVPFRGRSRRKLHATDSDR